MQPGVFFYLLIIIRLVIFVMKMVYYITYQVGVTFWTALNAVAEIQITMVAIDCPLFCKICKLYDLFLVNPGYNLRK